MGDRKRIAAQAALGLMNRHGNRDGMIALRSLIRQFEEFIRYEAGEESDRHGRDNFNAQDVFAVVSRPINLVITDFAAAQSIELSSSQVRALGHVDYAGVGGVGGGGGGGVGLGGGGGGLGGGGGGVPVGVDPAAAEPVPAPVDPPTSPTSGDAA